MPELLPVAEADLPVVYALSWVLRVGREGAAEFFSKLGFEPSSVAMERRRA